MDRCLMQQWLGHGLFRRLWLLATTNILVGEKNGHLRLGQGMARYAAKQHFSQPRMAIGTHYHQLTFAHLRSREQDIRDPGIAARDFNDLAIYPVAAEILRPLA